MSDESARIARLEGDMAAVMRELSQHVADCANDRRQTRQDRAEDRQERDRQHAENAGRLRAIEDKITAAQGAAWLMKWIYALGGTAVGLGVLKLLGLIR